MSEIRGSSEEILRTILTGMSDRVAGRAFRNGTPDFFGTPSAPSLDFLPEEPPDALVAPGAVDGADVGGGVDGGGGGSSGANVFTGSLSWGGHANGRIPAEEMVEIGGGHRLESNAAKDWQRLVAAAAKDGIDISITDSYRSYDAQVDVRRRKGHLVATATPGTSNHGWGRALDINVNDREVLRWLRANGQRFGFVNPEWARKPGKSYEPWHWEYRKHPSQQEPPGHVEAHEHNHAGPVPSIDFSAGAVPRPTPREGVF